MNQTTSTENTVLSDIEITGSLNFKGTLHFEGKLRKGSIAGETLFVGKSADIKGNITTDILRMDGNVIGDITVNGKCTLGDSAVLTGDIKSSSLVMAEGAIVIGQMQIGSQAEQLKVKS